MKAQIKITKFGITNVPAQYQEEEGCVAFQKVQLEYSFYGSKQKDIFDTKILKDNSQFIISGNGFIKDNFQIA